jgi:NADH dehydrogenase
VDVRPDLTVPGFPGVLVAGDLANIPGPDGQPLPQLGAVALQAGRSAADAVLRGLDGAAPEPFRYHDKGMMAMIARGAAVAEVGHGRHVVRGHPAFAAWLAVHAALMSGVRERADAFVRWAWEALAPSHRAPGLHLSEEGRIDWDEEAGRSDDPGA